jgi:hypothetical protein
MPTEAWTALSTTPNVITEQDVLDALDMILEHGHGTLELIVSEGYIRTMHQKYSRQGAKPAGQ